MLFVIIERFRPGRAQDVYRRFRERGRLAPEDVRYVSSWIDLGFERCFQVMEAPDEDRVHAWTRNWDDLVEFEVVPVRTSAEASEAIDQVGPSVPIACTLTTEQLESRRGELLPGLMAKARRQEPVPGGIRLSFDARAGLVEEIASVVAAEQRCCAFLRFDVRVEPANGPVTLEVTGPPGTEEQLASLA